MPAPAAYPRASSAPTERSCRIARGRWTTSLVAGILTVSLVGVPASATAAAAQSPPAQEDVISAAGLEPSDLIEDFFKAAAKEGGKEAAGFLFSGLLFGDPTQEKLDRITDKLNAIQQQLMILEAEVADIKRDVDASTYVTIYERWDGIRSALDGMIKTELADVIAGYKTWLAAPTAENRSAFLADVLSFQRRYESAFDGYQESLQGLLLPSPGPAPTSLTSAWGQLRVDDERYLTREDSDDLRAVMDTVQQYQALAAWIDAEYAVSKSNPGRVTDTLVPNLKGYVAATNSARPDSIPRGAVVDRGPDGTRVTTRNKPMFLAADESLFWRPGQSAGVPTKISNLNSNAISGQGFADWKVPTLVQVNGLLANYKPTKMESTADYLTDLFAIATSARTLNIRPFATGDSVWLSDQKRVPVLYNAYICGRHYKICHSYVYFNTQIGLKLGATGASSGISPALPSGGDNWGTARANSVVTALFNKTANRLLASRDTGPLGVMGEAGPPSSCRGARATVVGTEFDDSLSRGMGGSDVVVARGGKDVISSRRGDDMVCAGSGDDVVAAGAGSDTVAGQAGNDLIRGGTGRDVLLGQAGNDRLFGQRGPDRISGGAGADVAFGGAGADLLRGEARNDVLSGQAGDDRMFGGAGNDRLVGGPGEDVHAGGPGNDSIGALDGERDTVSCGTGRDVAVVDSKDRVAADCEVVRRAS